MLQPFKIVDKKTGKVLTVYGDAAPTEQDQEELFDAYEKGTWKPSPPPKPFTITDEKTKLSLTVYGDEAPTKEQEQELFSAYRKGTWRPAARPVYRTDEELTAAVKNREEQGEAPEDVKMFVEQALKDRQNERTRELKSMFAAQTSSPFGAMGLANMDPALRREMLEAQTKPTPAAISETPASGQIGDIGMKVAVPLAVGIATRNPLAMAAAGGGIDMLVQQREEMRGEPVKSAPVRGTRVLTESVLTAINPPALKAGTGVAQGAFIRGAQTGAMVGAGELAQQVVGQATGQDVVDIGEVFDVATLGAMFGGAFGVLETAAPAIWAKVSKKKPSEALEVLRQEPKTPEVEKAIESLQQVVQQNLPAEQILTMQKAELVREAVQQRAREAGEQIKPAPSEEAAKAFEPFEGVPPPRPAKESARVFEENLDVLAQRQVEGMAPRPVDPVAAIEKAVGIRPAVAAAEVPQGYSPAAPGAKGQVAPGERVELTREARAAQAMEAFEKLPPQTRAEEAARIFQEEAAKQDRAIAFSAKELEDQFAQTRLGTEEKIPLTEAQRLAKMEARAQELEVEALKQRARELKARPGEAKKEQTKIAEQRGKITEEQAQVETAFKAEEKVPPTPSSDVAAVTPPPKPMPELSPQAQAMMDRYGGANVGVLANLATGGGGFVVGWNTGEGLPPEERLKRALAFGAGGAFTPTAIRRIIGMQGWANRIIKERGVGSGALNTADPQILAALSVKGAALVGEGVKNFAEWGDKMVREFGDSIRPKLKEIWAAGQEADIIPNKLVDKAPERPPKQIKGLRAKGLTSPARKAAAEAPKTADIPTEKELKDAADSQRGAPETQMLRSQRAITDAGGPAIYADALEHIGDLAHRVQEPRYLGSGGAGEKIQRFMRVFFPGKNRMSFEQELEEGLRGTAEYRVIKKHPELEVEGEPRWMAYEKARTQYADEIKKNIAEGREEMIRQGREYAKVHLGENKPVTYAGKLGRDAAIALGEMNFSKLRNILSELNDFYGKYADTPEIYSRQKPAAAPAAAEAPKMDPRIAGYITKQLAIPMGSFAGGFTYGFIEGAELPPDQRLINGLQWAAVAGGIGYAVAKRSLNSINGERVSEAAAKKLAPDAVTGDEVLAKVRKTFTPDPTELTKEQKFLTTPQAKLLQAFQNVFRPLSQVEEALVGRGEGVLLGDAASMVAGAVGKAEAALYLVQENQQKLIPQISKETLNDYLFLRRVVDRLTDRPDIGKFAKDREVAGYTLEQGRIGLDAIRKRVGDEDFIKLEEFARIVQTSADEDLKLMVRSGRMSEQAYNEIKAMNEFYAPFYVMEYFSQMDGATEMLGKGALDTTQPLTKAIKGIKDEDFKLLDIMTGFQINKMRAQVLADKNNVMRRMAELSRVDTEHRFMKDLGTKMEAKYSGEIPKGWEVVNYMEGGVKKQIAVLPEVAQAVKGMDTIRAGAFMTTLASFASPLRAGATGLNAGFQIVNVFKDAARMGIMSKYGIEKNPVDFFTFVGDLLVGATHSIRSNLLGDKSQLYLDFLKSGAARSTLAANLVPDALARAAQQGDDKLAANILKVPLRSFISGTEKFGNAIEESIKLAGFRRGVRAEGLGKLTGKAYDDALERIAYEIRNYAGSPDFSKHGTHGKALNVLFMFANARIQGTAADLRRIIGRTGDKERNAAVVRLAAGIGTATGYLWYLNHQPENVEDYNKRSLSERNAYFLWPRYTETGDPMYYINEEGQKVREYFRFPKFEVVGMMANVLDAGLNYAAKRDPKGIMEMGKVALENLSPIPVTGRNMQERIQSVASGLNPVFKAPLEIATNKSFFQHRDIVKQRLQGVRPEEQYLETTPKPFISLAQAMPEVAPDFLRSPLYLKQLTENFTGSMVTQFMRPQLEGRSSATTNPLVARFFAAPILDEQETWDQINGLKTEQSTKNLLRQRAIDQYIKDSASYTPAQRMQSLAQLLASDPERNAAAMYNALLDRNRGVTDVDRAVRSLEPQFRAQFLEEKVRKMETKEQRDAFYREMILKGIINDKTLEEILKLRTAPEGKKTSMKEGKLYRDPTTGVMKIYRNGAFV